MYFTSDGRPFLARWSVSSWELRRVSATLGGTSSADKIIEARHETAHVAAMVGWLILAGVVIRLVGLRSTSCSSHYSDDSTDAPTGSPRVEWLFSPGRLSSVSSICSCVSKRFHRFRPPVAAMLKGSGWKDCVNGLKGWNDSGQLRVRAVQIIQDVQIKTDKPMGESDAA